MKWNNNYQIINSIGWTLHSYSWLQKESLAKKLTIAMEYVHFGKVLKIVAYRFKPIFNWLIQSCFYNLKISLPSLCNQNSFYVS